MKPLAKNLARLKEARKLLNLSLRDVERETGISRQALSAYERGKYPPREDAWNRLKKVLQLEGSVEDYWGRSALVGKPRLYNEGSKCRFDKCEEKPVVKGLCRKHYQRLRYQRISRATAE